MVNMFRSQETKNGSLTFVHHGSHNTQTADKCICFYTIPAYVCHTYVLFRDAAATYRALFQTLTFGRSKARTAVENAPGGLEGRWCCPMKRNDCRLRPIKIKVRFIKTCNVLHVRNSQWRLPSPMRTNGTTTLCFGWMPTT